jgi:hypothetical protein
MIAIAVCLLAFVVTAWAGSRSLVRGILTLLAVGYLYGIVRANLPAAASHFIFDAALLGLYVTQRMSWRASEGQKNPPVRLWAMVLIAWPLVLAFVPFQNIWVTLVGLRGNILFLPLILLGCRLKNDDLRTIAKGLAIMNLVALVFGLAEYSLGLEAFFPRNEVTDVIYASNDVAGGQYRIPSFFMSAHAYAGVMVMTLPWLFGAWSQRDPKRSEKPLFILGILAALAGILLSATRLHFAVAAVLVLVATLTGRISVTQRFAWLAALGLVGILISGNERLQRFTTLSDTALVTQRVGWSVNEGFWEILTHHPFGNGLGGGGTSMPYFLQGQIRDPIMMENEYARIVAEQGLIGLLLWATFIIWHLQYRVAFQKTPWLNGRRLGWLACTLYFGTGFIGTGLLTAIPQTPMILLCLGWISTPELTEEDNRDYIEGGFAVRRRMSSSVYSS